MTACSPIVAHTPRACTLHASRSPSALRHALGGIAAVVLRSVEPSGLLAGRHASLKSP